jgi:hypothetical protein
VTVALVKPFPCTARERRFAGNVEVFISSGGTHRAVIASLDAIDAVDKVAAFEQLLAEVVNPVDRELFQIGLSIVQGGAQ